MKLKVEVLKKRYMVIITALVVSLSGFFAVQLATAQTPSPGSDSDPIVTQSYVDKKISEQAASIAQLTTKVNSLTKSNTTLSSKVDKLTEANTGLAARADKLAEANEKLAGTVKELSVQVGQSPKPTDGTQVKIPRFQSVRVPKGKQLITGASSELIVVTGQAVALKGKAGVLLNISAGVDARVGYLLSIKHLYLSSTEDGRGFRASTDVSVLVKGTYTIK